MFRINMFYVKDAMFETDYLSNWQTFHNQFFSPFVLSVIDIQADDIILVSGEKLRYAC